MDTSMRQLRGGRTVMAITNTASENASRAGSTARRSAARFVPELKGSLLHRGLALNGAGLVSRRRDRGKAGHGRPEIQKPSRLPGPAWTAALLSRQPW